MNPIIKRLQGASLAVLALGLSCATGHGAVLYSGVGNVPISSTFSSVYIDIDGFSSSTTQSAGSDLEAFFGGEGIGNSVAFQPSRQTVSVDSPILRLNAGDVVDGSGLYYTAEAGSSTHVGAGAQQFVPGTEGYIGFRFTENDGDGPYYGWMKVVLFNNGTTGTIVDWAYDNTGAAIAAGAVPEIQSTLLVSLGTWLFALRRRRK